MGRVLMDEKNFARNSAWILGFISVFCSGLFSIPTNLQGTIVYGLTLILTWMRIRHLRSSSFDSALLYLLAGLVFSVLLAITTNGLLVFALHASIWFLLADFLLRWYASERYSSFAGFIRSFGSLISVILRRFFSPEPFLEFFNFSSPGSQSGERTQNPRRWPLMFGSVIGGIILFYIFHFLFSEINVEYSKFMNPIVQWLWSVFFKNLSFTVIHAYLIFILLTGKRFESRIDNSYTLPALSAVVVLVAVVVVTGVFSYFQTRFILIDAPELKFTELSQYTQQGFRQLIVALMLGYCIALLAIQSSERPQSRSVGLVILIFAFLAELLLASFFSAHKLIVLQSVFGLKDQRILASLGVLFAFFSLALLAWKTARPGGQLPGFRYQILFLLFTVAFASIFNVDYLSTKVNTIRYYKDQKSYPDYSYLFGNSFDNVSEWPRLMREMQEQNPPHPGPGYFWGFESNSGSDFFRGKYSPFCTGRPSGAYTKLSDGTPVVLPTQLLAEAFGKYGDIVTEEGTHLKRPFALNKILDFNLREYQAYKLTQISPEELHTFQQFANAYCNHQKP
ncbi:MAG: DUF4173 domain-containing protein [Spirochaetia bacterium]|nr:DUF4173 domain-containing protein [Spirochaetia bacterium]